MKRGWTVLLISTLLFGNHTSNAVAESIAFKKKLTFVTNQGGRFQVYLMDQDGRNREPLIDLENNQFGYPIGTSGASWSSDGTAIAFTGNVSSINLNIYTIDSDGTNLRQLTDLNNQGEYNISPTWSPDNTKIAFVSERDGGREIYVMNSDGSGQTRLTTGLGYSNSPAWSPDGSQIAFTSRREGNDQIYLMNPDGSNQVKLLSSASLEAANPSWSPDGSALAFDRAGEIYVVNRDGRQERKAFSSSGTMSGFDPSWSPDGLALAFTADAVVGTETFLISLIDGNLTRITENSFEDQEPNWQPHSPAEKRLILDAKVAAEYKRKQDAEAAAAKRAAEAAAAKRAAEERAEQRGAEAAAAKRQAEKKIARDAISNWFKTSLKVTVETFKQAEIAGITLENIEAVQSEILALPEESRSDIVQILKVARKYEVIGKIASNQVNSMQPNEYVEIGLIPETSKNKFTLVSVIRKLPSKDRDSYAEVKLAIANEMATIQARKDRSATIKDQIFSRRK